MRDAISTDHAASFTGMLVEQAVDSRFRAHFGMTDVARLDARLEAERDAKDAIESVLRERVRDSRWKLEGARSRERYRR